MHVSTMIVPRTHAQSLGRSDLEHAVSVARHPLLAQNDGNICQPGPSEEFNAGLRTQGSANRTEQVTVAERLAETGNRAGQADELTRSRIIAAGNQDRREG